MRAIELYHVQGNGWNDIGYNFLVDKYGQIFEGRYGGITRPVIGAHAQGFNSGSVGISVIGDYGSTSISPAARAALVSLIAWRLDLAHVDPLSKVVRVSAGNPRYAAGTAVTLNAISGPPRRLPDELPRREPLRPAAVAAHRGLADRAAEALLAGRGRHARRAGPLHARGSRASVAWTVTVRDDAGATVASGTGTGSEGRLDLGRDRRHRAALRVVDHGAADARRRRARSAARRRRSRSSS